MGRARVKLARLGLGKWLVVGATVVSGCADDLQVGIREGALQTVEEIKPVIADIGKDLGTGVKDAMDEAFRRMDELVKETETRKAAREREYDQWGGLVERVASLEGRLVKEESDLKETSATLGTLKQQVDEGIPRIVQVRREDRQEFDSKMREASREAAARYRAVLDRFVTIEGTTSEARARLASLEEDHRGAVNRLEQSVGELRKKMDGETTRLVGRIDEEVASLKDELRETKHDVMAVVGAVVAIGTLVVGVYQAVRRGREARSASKRSAAAES